MPPSEARTNNPSAYPPFLDLPFLIVSTFLARSSPLYYARLVSFEYDVHGKPLAAELESVSVAVHVHIQVTLLDG